MSARQNKGEWSELYAFIKLLKDGKIYAADEYVNKIEDVYFPILKLIRTDENKEDLDYHTGSPIRIYKNGVKLAEVTEAEIENNVNILYEKIFTNSNGSGAFDIPEIDAFLDNMLITQIKAPSRDKVDIRMQIHDINTGHSPVAGFSIKSDMGSAPTLLNSGHNTKFRFELTGLTDEDMNRINSIDKSVDSKYMLLRCKELFNSIDTIKYCSMNSDTYENNLTLIDSLMPEIYGYFIMYHYATMNLPMQIDCESLCKVLDSKNPIGYNKADIYTYKIKKLLCASALGMTPGKPWDGYEAATGGYIIVKKDGDVLCYHIYNRNFFEEYLLKNTVIDRPSSTRYDYGYVFKKNDKYYIDFNIQIRFKSISAANNNNDDVVNDVLKYIDTIKNKLV